ncbi:enolase C-terminal domain-like protein [Streptomyces sp. NPDC050095]|uniref:enolase C-terminal domain-like protein n=1 Tax=unclassified Streptomyces TaxID=2593676 RepID=UPI0034376230
MTSSTIERLEITQVHEGVAPGDDAVFVEVHGGRLVGSYGPVSERIGSYAKDTLASAVRGADATDHRDLLERMRATARTAPSDSASWAVGAVDCAGWDLHGHLADGPVTSLLAPTGSQPSVAAYASWLSQDLAKIDDFDRLRRVAAGGWSFTKWGLRRAPRDTSDAAAMHMAQAVERCAQVLGTALAVDAVGTWTPTVAMAFARIVDTTGLCWLEDPLPHHDLDTYELLAATRLPLAVGERAHCDEDPAGLIQYVRPRALTLDVVGCGGLTRALQILAVARAEEIPIYPHGRSLVPGLHLAAAFPDAVPTIEYRLQWEPRRQRLYRLPLQPEHGHIHLPDTPGLGTTPRSTPWPGQR